MTSWNYRVVKRVVTSSSPALPDETLYDIQEVFYNEDGSIYGYCDADVRDWESPDELKATLQQMLEAFEKPILCLQSVLFGDDDGA